MRNPRKQKENWSFIMYDDAKFTLLPGICTRDPQTGVITAGTSVMAPQHPVANIATTYAYGIRHQEALELWHNYESACKFATKALDHAFGSVGGSNVCSWVMGRRYCSTGGDYPCLRIAGTNTR